MFGLNWPELLIIATVALIVIGPEDLPNMFRQLGRFTAKLREMSREFSRAMEQAAKESGVKDVVKDLKSVTSSKALGLDAVKDAADRFEKWDPLKNAAKPSQPMTARTLVPPPMPATPAPAVAAPATMTAPAAVAAEADYDEAADDLAEHAGVEPTIHKPVAATHGAATQALYDKQALRAQVLAEQTEKLKAIEAGTYQVPPAVPVVAPVVEAPAAVEPAAVRPAAKKRVAKAAAAADAPAIKKTRKTPGKETA